MKLLPFVGLASLGLAVVLFGAGLRPDAVWSALTDKPALTEARHAADLQEARQDARRYLSDFLIRASDPTAGWTLVTVQIRQPDGSAPWATGLTRTPEGGFAVTRNGASQPIDPSQIMDWGLIRDGHRYGYFAARAELPYLPRSERVHLSRVLSRHVIPPEWIARM